MSRTFVVDVLLALNADEIAQLRDFLSSPYHVKGYFADMIGPFFESLYDVLQKKDWEAIEKEDIHAGLYPGKPFIESRIDKLMSELKRLLERFLLAQQYFAEENEARQLLDLSAALRQKRMESRYEQVLEKTHKIAVEQEQTSLKSLLYRYQVALEEQEWHSTFNKVKSDLNIPDTIKHLDTYYYTHKTWMINHLKFMETATSKVRPDRERYEEVWVVPRQMLQQNAYLSLCWQVNQLLRKEEYTEQDFLQLLAEIQQQETRLSPESLAEFYAYLRNLCVIILDKGNPHLMPALHEINKDNLSRRYFYLNDKISPNAYLNITYIAVSVGDIQWANTFVEEHKDRLLEENETRDFYHMNKALCLFGERKYEAALSVIPFGSTYSYYHLMARRLELKIYYELQSDLLDHKIDAFKMFIRRAGKSVFSDHLHELFTNFVNLLRQLALSHGPEAKKRSVVLQKRIAEKKNVAEHIWLLEKAKELGKRR